jgi:hypothetical protein
MLEHLILFLGALEYVAEVAEAHLGCLLPLVLEMLHLHVVLHVVRVLEHLLALGALLLALGCASIPEYVDLIPDRPHALPTEGALPFIHDYLILGKDWMHLLVEPVQHMQRM